MLISLSLFEAYETPGSQQNIANIRFDSIEGDRQPKGRCSGRCSAGAARCSASERHAAGCCSRSCHCRCLSVHQCALNSSFSCLTTAQLLQPWSNRAVRGASSTRGLGAVLSSRRKV